MADETPKRPRVASSGPRTAGAAEVAAAALAAGKGVQEAAEAAGIGRRTLSRWLTDPAFVARVDALRCEAVARAMNRLSSGMSAAATVLMLLLGSKDEHVRYKAAVKTIELAVRLRDSEDFARRIGDLERRLAEAKP